jgi:hypothetical protein
MAVATQDTIDYEELLNYLLVLLVAFLAALVTIPLHRYMVESSYEGGFYRDRPWTAMAPPIVIAIVTAIAANKRIDRLTAGTIVLLACSFNLLVGEYLVGHFLISQYLIDEGLEALPLLLPPDITLEVYQSYFATDPRQFLAPVFGPLFAGYIVYRGVGVVRQKGRTGGFGPMRRYSSAKTRASGLAALFLAGIVSCVLIMSISYQMDYGIAWVGCSALLLVAALIWLGMTLRHFNDQVVVYPDRITITQGASTHEFLWDDVVRVWRVGTNSDLPLIGSLTYILEDRNGQQARINHQYIENISELSSIITHQTTQRLLPLAVEALKNGEAVDFGAVKLNRDGVVSAEKQVPWAEIKTLDIAGDMLQMKSQFGLVNMEVPLDTTSNLNVLFTIVSRMIQ